MIERTFVLQAASLSEAPFYFSSISIYSLSHFLISRMRSSIFDLEYSGLTIKKSKGEKAKDLRIISVKMMD